eukprot:gene5313-3815_t
MHPTCITCVLVYSQVLLKQLKKACESNPHFVQDIRVLLSFPLVDRSSKFPPVYAPNHRPGKECLLVDTDALFHSSREDLRRSIERNLEQLAGNRLPLIAAHILYNKELNWVIKRLQKVLDTPTNLALQELIKIGDQPSGNDFIPDSFFDSDTRKREGQVGSSSDLRSPAVQLEGDSVLYSAGAIGHQRDLVVLSRREKEFPLLHSFVGRSALGDVCFDERYTEKKHLSGLIGTIPQVLSNASETNLSHVSVRVEVLPFDSEYKDKSEAGVGIFGTAHRYFYVHLSLKPQEPTTVANIVNVHFFRLELQNKELVENVGYLDSTNILRMVRDKMKDAGIDEASETQEKESQTSREFKVVFKSECDGPVIVKGILYFKHGESEDVIRERAIQAIPFGPKRVSSNNNRNQKFQRSNCHFVVLYVSHSCALVTLPCFLPMYHLFCIIEVGGGCCYPVLYQSPWSSLSLHYSVRLLWLPLQCCLKMANGSGLQSISGRQSSSRSTVTLGTATTFYDEEEVYGFEIRLKEYFKEHAQVTVAIRDGAVSEAHLRFFVGSQLSASQWQNMDSFRATQGVIIVLNCAVLPCKLQDALYYVITVFEANFSDITCRCIVLNPPQPIDSYTKSKNFLTVVSSDPIEAVGQQLKEDIAQSVAKKLSRKVQSITSLNTSSLLSLRTPVDKSGTAGLPKNLIASRYAKIKGDLLLQLGAVDDAMASYGSTYFSSTLVQFAQRTFLKLQSDAAELDEPLLESVAHVEQGCKTAYEEFRKDVKLLKKSAVPHPLYHYLRHDLQESMSESVAHLSSALTRLRASVSAADDNRAFYGKQLYDVVQKYVRFIEMGVDALLRESLTQLKLAGQMFKLSLSDRELETHFKWTSFLSRSKPRRNFLAELQIMLRISMACRREEVIRRAMMYGVVLCLHNECFRTAIALLVRLAIWEQERQNHVAAVEAIVFACAIEGLRLPGITQLVTVPHIFQPSSLKRQSSSDGDVLPGFARGNNMVGCISPNSMFELLLLKQLMRVVDNATIRTGILCRIANYTLFRYSKVLTEEEQKEILTFAQSDASNVPFMAVTEDVFPFVAVCEPVSLPSHLAPKTVAICGPLFTYIDTQRLQFTVLSLNGKKLENSVVWAVGDVGTCVVTISNPLKFPLKFCSVSLFCKQVSLAEENPMCYVLQDVELGPEQIKCISLGVVPRSEGEIVLEGVEIQLHYMGSTIIRIRFPSSIAIPVLQRLPLLSCFSTVSDARIFSAQQLSFGFTVTNCSSVCVARMHVSAHTESCQLDDCRGCCEQANGNDVYVRLDKDVLQGRLPLGASETITIPAVLYAPAQINVSASRLLFFRVDYALDYGEVKPPPGIPSDIPVFGVVPRRVLEMPWRLSLESGLVVKSMELSVNKKYCSVRLANMNSHYSFSLLLHSIPFLHSEDTVVPPSSEHIISNLEVKNVVSERLHCSVPWKVETPFRAVGSMLLDFTPVKRLGNKAHYLHECAVKVVVTHEDEESQHVEWNNSNSDLFSGPCTTNEGNVSHVWCTPFSPALINLCIKCPWASPRKMGVRLILSTSEDLGTLSGPVDSWVELSDQCSFDETFEFVPFVLESTGLTVILSDLNGETLSILPIRLHYEMAYFDHSMIYCVLNAAKINCSLHYYFARSSRMPPKERRAGLKRQRSTVDDRSDKANNESKATCGIEDIGREEAEKVEHILETYLSIREQVIDLEKKRAQFSTCVEGIHKEAEEETVLLNVGGKLFEVPTKTLLGADEGSLFHSMLSLQGNPIIPIMRDEKGAIFVDRDPAVFRHILNYLRGYRKIDKIDGTMQKLLRLDAEFFRLPRLVELLEEKHQTLQFRPGPGVNPDRDRLRVAFGVALVGENDLVTGKHRITFKILAEEYVGVGIVSDACANTDHEFHKTPQCCVYYMSGVFYSNYPHHKKEEISDTVSRFGKGDCIDIEVDMDKGLAEFRIGTAVKLISIGKAKRLRFAVTAKANSTVEIVQHEATKVESGTEVGASSESVAFCLFFLVFDCLSMPAKANPSAPPQGTQELTTFVQNLLQQMQTRFEEMSGNIINRIDEMASRIDELEKSISELMQQAGAEEGDTAAASPTNLFSFWIANMLIGRTYIFTSYPKDYPWICMLGFPNTGIMMLLSELYLPLLVILFYCIVNLSLNYYSYFY